MGKRDPRVDAYIRKSAAFAQPVLTHLRRLIHQACPDVAESIKWGAPHFAYEGMLCQLASFKSHCAMRFWKGQLVKNRGALAPLLRLTSAKDLPGDRVLMGYIKECMEINRAGRKVPVKRTTVKKHLRPPRYFTQALQNNRKARATYQGFSYTNKRDYLDWITEAKTDATRSKRLRIAIKWMAEGKIRNWKYVKS